MEKTWNGSRLQTGVPQLKNAKQRNLFYCCTKIVTVTAFWSAPEVAVIGIA